MKKEGKEILTLALDRMQSIEHAIQHKFIAPKNFDATTYFNDIIGVTKNIGDTPKLIRFKASRQQAPYIITKPLHPSQQMEEKLPDGVIFSITVIPNFELERELLGFGNGLQVLSPESLVKRLRKITQDMQSTYAS